MRRTLDRPTKAGIGCLVKQVSILACDGLWDMKRQAWDAVHHIVKSMHAGIHKQDDLEQGQNSSFGKVPDILN